MPLFRKSRWFYWIFILLAVILILISLGIVRSCSKIPRPVSRPVSVRTETAHSADVPVYVTALGTVTPIETVTVRTQINGILWQVFYREGQLVKAGDRLAQIDPRPYLAQLHQFQGQLAHDEAQLANARVDLKRYQQLYPQGAVSQQVYATQAALVKELQGTIAFDKGQIETVQVNLIYTRITSPINGRVGLRLVDPGNFVQTADTNGLVVVNEVQPITVIFSVPEDDIPQIADATAASKNIVVQAYDRTQNTLLDTGFLLTLDNQINTNTGTVNLRAQFDNPHLNLFPNQFVNINLLVNTLKNATLVPTAAIQHGPKGTFVYVINEQQRAILTPVVAGIVSAEDTVITSGVTPNQRVVVEGADQISNNSLVKYNE